MPIPAGKRRVTFDLDEDLYNRVAEIAKAQERDVTSQIRFALKQWLETQTPERTRKVKTIS